jgi:hypothetical protein
LFREVDVSSSRPGRRTRRVVVFLHVVVSLGWMGAGAANVVLAATALTVPREVARVCYQLIDRIEGCSSSRPRSGR